MVQLRSGSAVGPLPHKVAARRTPLRAPPPHAHHLGSPMHPSASALQLQTARCCLLAAHPQVMFEGQASSGVHGMLTTVHLSWLIVHSVPARHSPQKMVLPHSFVHEPGGGGGSSAAAN